MEKEELIPHLFRTEYTKITSVLCKLFGFEHIEVAEDIAGETFLLALETWSFKGLPPNPVAWLYAVAKNKAVNHLKRGRLFQKKIQPHLHSRGNIDAEFEIDLSEKNISDSLLQMMFAICQPCISQEAQIGLALRILCGFSADEIANAFLCNKETINKRLYRAKEKLRKENIAFAFPPANEMVKRLDAVLVTIYLLFSEGYYSESNNEVLREDLCMDAIRLTHLLTENEQTNLPGVNSLLALMYFHSSRFKARKDKNGTHILYGEQDVNLWNNELVQKGIFYLKAASVGNTISKYHLEAAIAYWHTIKEDTCEKWENIFQLYNYLLQVEYSPVAALNRAFALSKIAGKEEAIKETEKLQLTKNQFYYTLLGQLYKDIDNPKAKINLEKALLLAKNPADKNLLRQHIEDLALPG